MYTGINFLPLCTAIVCPTISGRIVERRDHVFTTFFSLRVFNPSIFTRRWSSINGPFFSERGIFSLFLDPAQFDPLRPAHFPKPTDRTRNAMRLRAERANKARSLRVRNLVHNHGPPRLAQPVHHLRRGHILRRNFHHRLCRGLYHPARNGLPRTGYATHSTL